MVEMLIALAVLGVLLTVILIPIRAGFESFNVGKAKVDNQTAMQNSLDDLERDLRRAVYVFPNRALQGVTFVNGNPRTPFSNVFPVPYTKSLLGVNVTGADVLINNIADNNTPTKGVCDVSAATPSAEPFANAARVDMVLARTGDNGVVLPIEAGATIVSYYPRRLNINAVYDAIDNPLVLFRAEMPFRSSPTNGNQPSRINSDGAVVAGNATTVAYNALVAERFPATCTDQVPQNRSSLWIEHNIYGESNLEPVSSKDVNASAIPAPDPALQTEAISASHTLAIPRGLFLVSSSAVKVFNPLNPYGYDSTDKTFKPPAALSSESPIKAPLVPDSTFDLSDTNNDGKIDRVSVSLAIATLDASNAANIRNGKLKGQQLRVTRTVDLPNVR